MSLTGVSIDQIALADEPAAWEALGFTSRATAAASVASTLDLRGTEAGRGILGWSLRGIAGGELDGLATTISETAGRGCGAGAPERGGGD